MKYLDLVALIKNNMEKPILIRSNLVPAKADVEISDRNYKNFINLERIEPLHFESGNNKKIDNIMTPNRKLVRRSSILDEMGFGHFISPEQEILRKLTRKPTIGVSDFWSAQEKEKFLKEKGFWLEYKATKQKEEFHEGKRLKGLRHSSLPYLLDLKTERKIITSTKKSSSKPRIASSNFSIACSTSETPTKQNGNKKLTKIDTLVKKCNNLAHDMNEIRISTKALKDILVTDKRSKKRKITRTDLCKIKNSMNSLF